MSAVMKEIRKLILLVNSRKPAASLLQHDDNDDNDDNDDEV
jgi:hypothetical protein